MYNYKKEDMMRFKAIRLSLLSGFVSIFGHLQAQEKASGGEVDQMSKGKTPTKEITINKLKRIESDTMKEEHQKSEPLACQLTGPEQARRKAVIQKEVFSQVKKVEETQAGYIFYFPYEESLLIKMTDFVIVENNCCPFFTFDIRLQAKNDVMLTISGSSEKAKEMIAMALIQKK